MLHVVSLVVLVVVVVVVVEVVVVVVVVVCVCVCVCVCVRAVFLVCGSLPFRMCTRLMHRRKTSLRAQTYDFYNRLNVTVVVFVVIFRLSTVYNQCRIEKTVG